MTAEVAVVILAGGEGSRMGGAKPLRSLGGRRLIDHALAQAWNWSETIAIAVREDSQVTPVDASLSPDATDVEGPRGGLIGGLGFAQDAGCDFLLTIPSDMPFLQRDLLEKLRNAIAQRGSALAASGGHLHPVCGLWRTSSLDRVPDYVASGRSSLRGFAELVGCVEVEWSTVPFDAFFNINSLEDLAAAERQLTR